MALNYTIISNNKNKRYVLLPNEPNAEIGFGIGRFNQERKEEGYCEKTGIGINGPKQRKQARISILQNRFHRTNIGHSSPIKQISSESQYPTPTDSGDRHSFASENLQCQGNRVLNGTSSGRSRGCNGRIASLQNVERCKNAKALRIKSPEVGSRNSVDGENSAVKESCLLKDSMNLGECNQRFPRTEKSDVGRGLNLLIDAIQLLENEEVHKATDLGVHKRVLASGSGKNVHGQAEDAPGGSSLQNHQALIDNGLKAGKDLASDQVSLQGDCQYNSKTIAKGGDIYQAAKPLVCSKRGRLQALPSKYSDSILQPWKKCARKAST